MEKNLESKTKSCQPRLKISKVEKHFKNLLGNPPEITDKPAEKIINSQLNIKLGQFMDEELDAILTKIKSRKAAGFNEISPEVWKTRKFDAIHQL